MGGHAPNGVETERLGLTSWMHNTPNINKETVAQKAEKVKPRPAGKIQDAVGVTMMCDKQKKG